MNMQKYSGGWTPGDTGQRGTAWLTAPSRRQGAHTGGRRGSCTGPYHDAGLRVVPELIPGQDELVLCEGAKVAGGQDPRLGQAACELLQNLQRHTRGSEEGAGQREEKKSNFNSLLKSLLFNLCFSCSLLKQKKGRIPHWPFCAPPSCPASHKEHCIFCSLLKHRKEKWGLATSTVISCHQSHLNSVPFLQQERHSAMSEPSMIPNPNSAPSNCNLSTKR